ncbi:hypothetical protein pEaSNUABM40_00193 [Erwinia phage pEa_SNUABM_40]|uniref:Uncharacterized protein n=1 Tax=Erwinia phage pEa_SNUABM_3 TaxID=2869552 RepID=A0AAE7XJJ3_9CAUD|nr:GTP-binding domain [Erwinia phage pEa_SNUABM_3]QZE56726.1 hypothetical protein pEaSNUABM20_00190 [Erwinia phage pEa_SNUABM_20]QZE58409.1 hypothetical protein pEaSNUABM40_00193 [Erwinia phage pEa_SNUABM_40]UAW52971.1 hypothetical protein pEaSNUABM23_00189 [Erwinia phage pEa_SNUABM_23]UIW10867.1 hypothetical protein pEaSNUABM23_00189 [Erwinia phage pEa_SNUABM_31]QZE56387.1 hypothetical protein pEaSNUABM3_00190 [Erwinia phage pEa_SNUABM_3]
MEKISFTGHRPQYLGGFSPEAKRRLYTFARRKVLAIEDDAIIYVGCALGFDMAVATAAIDLGHKVVSCLPYPGFNSRWTISSVFELDGLLNKSHEVRIVTSKEDWEHMDGQAGFALNKRNHYMVDETDRLISLCCGAPSGTQNCIDYALKQNKPVAYWWNDWLKFNRRS